MSTQQECIRKALQETVQEYNKWASNKAKGYDVGKSRNDLVGIVYNKLRKCAREAGVKFAEEKGNILKKHFITEDLDVEFTKDGYLTKLHFNRPTRYSSKLTMDTIVQLQEQTPHIIYEVHCEDACYQIRESINNIQSFQL